MLASEGQMHLFIVAGLVQSSPDHGEPITHLACHWHGPIRILSGQLSVIINFKHNQVWRVTYKRSVHLHGQLDTHDWVSGNAGRLKLRLFTEKAYRYQLKDIDSHLMHPFQISTYARERVVSIAMVNGFIRLHRSAFA